ncbi:hypothetical protein ACIGFL_08850 [Pseudomonas sp. NPDC077649]|uniref:hypothetical protein n=1 Tax=Pseudomonas sp. NPDC077649 TaxID=3364423 RepID=UPI0037C6A813
MTIIQILQFAQSVVFAGALVIAVVATNNFNERLTLIEDNQRSLEAAFILKHDIQSEQLSRVLGILQSPMLCASPPSLNIRTGSHDVQINDSNIQR